jgi:NADPH:quinone reductase-like Zn-dependent oxidoreductase
LRALTISANGGLDQIEFRDDLPTPAIRGPHDVRVRVQAAALNRLDLFVVGGLPRVTITPPWILGSDATGVVEAVGEAVTRVSVGDTVVLDPGTSCGECEYCRDDEPPLCVRYSILGEHEPGVFAEYVVVPEGNVYTVPAEIPVAERAALPLATLTAWRMVVTRARVHEGDDVLIWGIGGGVAQAALQIAKLRGARVWVTSGDDAKLERARALGADVLVNHRTQDVVRELRAATAKRGMDVVIDNVGEATWARSLGVLGRRGRLVTCGATSGPIVETDVRRLFWNQWTIMGSTMGSSAEFQAMIEAFRAGHLRPPVDSVFPLEEGRAAFERLAAGEQFGKVVLKISDA